MPRQQRMLSFALVGLFGITRHIQTTWPGGTQHQIDPFQRHVRSGQRIAQPGQLQRFIFIHRQNRNVLFQEIAPPLRVVGDHVLGAERQYHRYIVLFGKLDRLHGRRRHRLTFLATHQIGRQHQCRGTGNHLFRHAFRPQLIHLPWADGEGALTAFTDQREAATNSTVNRLQVVKIGTAGGIAQIAVGVAANLDIAAHHAEQHRAVIRQH
ncbi:hypothetical protein D3C78_1279170 [compost metagenome]